MSDDFVKMGLVAVVGLVVGAGVAVGLVEPVVTDKPPETPAIHAPCPSGWADTSATDAHAVVLACQKDDWLVILHFDGSFSHAIQKDTPGATFIYDPREVPGWPD